MDDFDFGNDPKTGGIRGFSRDPQLPEYFKQVGPQMTTQQRGALRAAVAHLENANTAIYDSILKKITRPVTETTAGTNPEPNGTTKTKK